VETSVEPVLGTQGIDSVVVPAKLTVITPPYAQLHVEVLFSAGKLLIWQVAEPGLQGVVTGIHGIGVKTPSAAAVAAATVGLDGVVHIANGLMLAIGAKSMIVAAIWFSI
jgi:hypothetical protein